MNMLVDGEWRTDVYRTTNEQGEFERQETAFRDWIEDSPDARFQPEAGRYHLYVSYACPWAHRTLIARKLLGLEDAISVDVVDPYRGEDGWQFTPEKDGCTPDTVNGADFLREIYMMADPEMTGRVTVPVLWDKQEETIVNNESKEIMRMLGTEFGDVADRDVDLYPEGYREEVDRIIEAIYEPINNGVYRTGFADSQAAYDRAVEELFDALDHWDSVLSDQRYLAGDRLTEADIAMFTTLVRFDEVYHTHFMCNHRLIREYDNLWPYLRDVYQTGVAERSEGTPDGRTRSEAGVAETVHMDHIKEHYYTTHPEVSPKRIVPKGPDSDFEKPHDRDELPGGLPDDLRAAVNR
ncbi:glutathione S-transferase family protein [Halapricum hydrolyticum]|uniref:Glutathione S-transferase family protein n=1 Tax=Halapricum hydrolyticum TaxID=2979991 RepID=A0AAE3I9B2_9EURY|nr:glutathione S-transferase family protein [Halapricum hydrolyticum]MCU4717259.1 glutathione S-transferase family protein [Halapricum hydrolyticum]MCU4726186.1 glutathione S-transferase family protein [Halapricum hydrolyticum]